MKFIYCPLCGGKLEEKYSWDEGGVPYCPVDDKMFFDTPKPCIVVAVIKDTEILLLKQSYIYEDCKVLLSGYVGNNETVEEAVYREVLEESGIEIDSIEYLGSDYVKDKEIVMLTYMARYSNGEIKKSDEVEGIEWCSLNKAIDEMYRDEIGKKIVKKVMGKVELNY